MAATPAISRRLRCVAPAHYRLDRRDTPQALTAAAATVSTNVEKQHPPKGRLNRRRPLGSLFNQDRFVRLKDRIFESHNCPAQIVVFFRADELDGLLGELYAAFNFWTCRWPTRVT